MENVATPETLALRWAEIVRDPSLQDLPYKIELSARGKIEMSPASNRHALLQAHLAAQFAEHLTGGRPLTECSILTEIGIRVPDVAWASTEFLTTHADSTPFPISPEILREITEDLRRIMACLLVYHAGRPPLRGKHQELDALLRAPWRYKPLQQAQSQDRKRRSSPKRSRQQKPSRA